MNQETARKNKSIDNVIRQLIIKKVKEDGDPMIKVARDLKINPNTIKSIIKVFDETGRIDKIKEKGHAKKKITIEIGNFIENLVERNATITLNDIKNAVKTNMGQVISIETIHRYLLSLKITLKRTTIILDRVNEEHILEKRRDFATFFLTQVSMDDKKNVFVDESGFNLHLRRNYGRSSTGTRATKVVPVVRGRNITLLSAINSEKIIYYKIFPGGCNSQIFSDFIINLDQIMVQEHGILDGCIFMDNARAHTARSTVETMQHLQNNTKFLSPYSYMINPIEFSFSKIKIIVRNKLGEFDIDLDQMIVAAITDVTSEDCQGWYRHIRRNCALAMQMHRFE